MGVLVISLRKQYEALSNTLSCSGQSDLGWRELAQEFGGTVDGVDDFSCGSNLNCRTKFSKSGPESNPWLLIGGQD